MRDKLTIEIDFDAQTIAVSDQAAFGESFQIVGGRKAIPATRSHYAGFLACRMLAPLLTMTANQLGDRMLKELQDGNRN